MNFSDNDFQLRPQSLAQEKSPDCSGLFFTMLFLPVLFLPIMAVAIVAMAVVPRSTIVGRTTVIGI